MARRGETGDDPASTMSAGGSHGESNGATGLYNVSNTCYLNSVLQALSHVREFRECLLSDEAGVSLYAAGPGRGRSPGRTPVPTPAEEILSFPGFKKKRKRKKGDDGDEEEETTVVPVCTCHPPASRRSLSADFGGERGVTPRRVDRCARARFFTRPRRDSRGATARGLARRLGLSALPSSAPPRDCVTWFIFSPALSRLTDATPDAVRPPAMTRTGRANIADADHRASRSVFLDLSPDSGGASPVAATREDTERGLCPARTARVPAPKTAAQAPSLRFTDAPETSELVHRTRRRASRGASHALVGRIRGVPGTSAESRLLTPRPRAGPARPPAAPRADLAPPSRLAADFSAFQPAAASSIAIEKREL